MRTIYIDSNELPSISVAVKECVNSGEWQLFKVTDPYNNYTHYSLVVDDVVYDLGRTGDIVAEHGKDAISAGVIASVYFSDIPQPKSISNMRWS